MEPEDLRNTVERKEHHLKALADMSVKTGTCRSIPDLGDYVSERICALLEGQKAALLLWDQVSNRLSVVGAVGYGEDVEDSFSLIESDAIPGKAWNRKEPVQEANSLAVPFHDREDASGVIYLERAPGEGGFDEEEINLLTLIASQTASSLLSVRLVSDLEGQLKNIRAAQEIGNLLVSTFDLDTVLKLIVRGIRDVTSAEICSIMLWDDSEEYLTIAASEGVPDKIVREAKVRPGENIAGWVAKEGRPLLIRDLDADPRFVASGKGRYRTKSLLSVPLKAKGQVLGVININNQKMNRILTEEDQNLMTLFSNQAAIALENARLYKELEKLAITDGLTGLANHRAFQERLLRELSRAQRFQQEVSLLIIDIDHFKSINDQHGHLVGDHVLRCVSRDLQSTLRTMDYVARYGGEEFAVIMPQTEKEKSLVIADRIREKFSECRWIQEDPNRSVTISIGVSEFPADAQEPVVLVDEADRALYASKQNGRNRVTAAVPSNQEAT